MAQEYDAYGIPIGPWSDAVARFVEACTLIRRMWTEEVGLIVRSVQLPVSYEDPASTREPLGQLAGAGFSHLVLNLAAPYPNDVARWVADELIIPTLDHLDHGRQCRPGLDAQDRRRRHWTTASWTDQGVRDKGPRGPGPQARAPTREAPTSCRP